MSGDKPQTAKPVSEKVIAILVEAGVFDVADGKIIINMHNGQVQSITIEKRTYQHVAFAPGLPRVLP